jgi:hypothetical protein
MNSNTETIRHALLQAFSGEPCPSFMSDEFAQTMKAIGEMTKPPGSGEPDRSPASQIGLQAARLILDRLMTSMHAERALAVMRDDGNQPC